jgi:glucan phosphoethanolaminetransferase (alkaline phosphatase superfamily)
MWNRFLFYKTGCLSQEKEQAYDRIMHMKREKEHVQQIWSTLFAFRKCFGFNTVLFSDAVEVSAQLFNMLTFPLFVFFFYLYFFSIYRFLRFRK